MAGLTTKYVWEFPVRATHWVNAGCIAILSVTGLYIGSPRSLGLDASQFVMGWVRFIHLVFAYIFTVSVLSRIYWSFAGNRYAGWRVFFPFLAREDRKKMTDTLRYYLFINKKVPHPVGHNALAGATYLLVFTLYLVMIFTGFALDAQHSPQSFAYKAFGWIFIPFTNQGVRLTHHMVMWLLIAFAIHHVYSSWLMDIKERGGVISGIFSGYKTVQDKD